MIRAVGLFVLLCVIFSCANIPAFVARGAVPKCRSSLNTCDEMTCIFREARWLTGGTLNYVELSDHLDEILLKHPDWTIAVQQAKTTCLVPGLPAQGYNVNCPPYDVTFCVMTTFIKNIPPSQWSTSALCTKAREYAAACPVCPDECFAPAIPVGSCNACRAVPRTP